MLTGEIRSQIDAIWNAFWSGGISNPLEVIEQITYLLFLKRLDDLQTLEENKARATGKPIERRVFPTGKDGLPFGENGRKAMLMIAQAFSVSDFLPGTATTFAQVLLACRDPNQSRQRRRRCRIGPFQDSTLLRIVDDSLSAITKVPR
jgi:hypothetical protein